MGTDGKDFLWRDCDVDPENHSEAVQGVNAGQPPVAVTSAAMR